jgi:hypothetical protein
MASESSQHLKAAESTSQDEPPFSGARERAPSLVDEDDADEIVTIRAPIAELIGLA